MNIGAAARQSSLPPNGARSLLTRGLPALVRGQSFSAATDDPRAVHDRVALSEVVVAARHLG